VNGISLGSFYFDLGKGRAGYLVEGRVESVGRDITEGELYELCP
jgi:hypothetical protein